MSDTTDLAKVDEAQMSASGQRFNWVGLNPVQIKSMAQAMALSGMFPDVNKDSAKAFVKIMAGQEMGIAPFQAMSDISIIEGKAAAGGNLHASKVKSSGRYDYRVKTWNTTECNIEFIENVNGKRESIGISTFTIDDARLAGMFDPLCPKAPAEHNLRKIERKSKYDSGKYTVEGCGCKDNWKKYPRNMLFNRAMTAGVRTYCPDALNGVNAYSPEELGAVVDEDGHVVDYRPQHQDNEPASATNPSRGDAQEAEIVDGKTIIEQVSEALESKGFEDADDRKAIALAVAGVDSPSQASPEQWASVLENIQTMSAEALTSLIPSTETTEEPVATQQQDAGKPEDFPITAAQKSMLIGLARTSPRFKEGMGPLDLIVDVAGKAFDDITEADIPTIKDKLKQEPNE